MSDRLESIAVLLRVMVSGRRGRKSRTIGDENGASVRDACERIVDRTNEQKYD